MIKTWEEVQRAKSKYLASTFSVGTTGWCKGVGVGFDMFTGTGYVLAIRVRDDSDIPIAQDLAKAIGWDGLTDVQAIGEIRAL